MTRTAPPNSKSDTTTKGEVEMVKVRPTKMLASISVIGVVLLLFGLTATAQASTYGVHECTSSQTEAADAQIEGSTTGYTTSNACGTNAFLQVTSGGAVGPGQSRAWTFTAPTGTKINRATGTYLMQGIADNAGHRPFFFYRGIGAAADTIEGWSGAGSGGGGFDSNLFGIGALKRIGAGVFCNGGSCPARNGIYSRIGDLGLQMEDTVAPDSPVLSGPALGGWINSTRQLNFNVSDTGAGPYLGGTYVNGTGVDIELYCAPATDASGAVKEMKPCPSNANGATALDPGASPFTQGDNSVQVCVWEYGEANLQSACKSETVKVDTITPATPTDLTVVGGQDWRRDNGFTLRFDGAVDQGSGGSPIVGASVRLSGPGGYSQTRYYPATDIDTIDDIELPDKGDYTADVYFRDAAGNESPANAASAHLRFDNTVPAPQSPNIANGWISRAELADGYLQGWEDVPLGLVPPSGIAGYRVVVNTNSDTDPCSGADDPRTCGGSITEVGRGNLLRTLHPGDLAEGANYVHVVPISGSGMRATDVRHTALKADFTDPETQLQGDGDGRWLNHDADLVVSATDVLSGMEDTPEFPFDDPPVVRITVDGSTTSGAPSVSTEVTGEGVHDVTWCSRDLAGNTSCAADSPVTRSSSGATTVRIDKTAPSAAFTNRQDPEDPDKLVATVSDALSGVAAGAISYRRTGDADWKALETDLADGHLVARVDSADLRPGTTYEFRVQSVDRAGNSATSTVKQNGEPMRVTGPFRTITSVADLAVNGRAKVRVKYGKRPRVTGQLVGSDGRGVANASVELVSNYLSGSKQLTRSFAVTTDGAGGFAARLPKGPGRTVVAVYNGDRRYLGARSAPAKVNVKSKVTLKVPQTVDSDRGIVFAGKVKAKGAKLGRRGKRLEIQVLVGRRWKTVGRSIRTNGKGRFRLPYRFTADYPHAVDYRFRAAVLKERGFPYLPAKSKKRKVTVKP